MPSAPSNDVRRRLPVGAECDARGVGFRVWAPARRKVAVRIEREEGTIETRLEPETGGYFSGRVDGARAGDLYRYRLDDGEDVPDPASRFQPGGPHGASQVVDARAFPWSDSGWRGRPLRGCVLYEMHVGTFTREGTWSAAARRLAELSRLGVTTVEVMPVAEFAGAFGWGYDGVDLFAPTRLYGTPDDFRAFVDRAHATGICVLLDVVYNHFGPDGNYLARFADQWVTKEHENEWGEAIDFRHEPVREFFAANAAYWIGEFHLDGLRLDATQAIFDRGGRHEHVISRIVREARAAAPGRTIVLLAENEPQDASLVRPQAAGGHGLDGLWNDDFHHAMRVALTGRREAYFCGYRGVAQELVSAARHGFLFQGQWYAWQRNRRGSPALDVPRHAFVHYLQNHDQVANTAGSARMPSITSPGKLRAATALLLLGPQTPLLFQGQETGSVRPFHYFADHPAELAEKVRKGRAGFLAQFPSQAGAAAQRAIPQARSLATLEACRLDEAERDERVHRLHLDLLAIRREDPVLSPAAESPLDGAVLSDAAFVLRWCGRGAHENDDRLLVVNLGPELEPLSPEPLLAPPHAAEWVLLWSSDELLYGGPGIVDLQTPAWRIPAESAHLLKGSPRT